MKRFCQTLGLVDEPELIRAYCEAYVARIRIADSV